MQEKTCRKKILSVNILNLSCYAIAGVEEDNHNYHINAVSSQSPTSYIHCRSQNIQGFGRREQLIKDLPMHSKRVGIYYVDTRRLVDWLGSQSISRIFTSLADEVGISEGTVRSIFRDYINELEKLYPCSRRHCMVAL